ncbi:MAG: SufE family protein [Pedosphaera sp.]|nr:SufE family protein [Pedosphaera sp.]MST01258.1 SufE family protein [Pedosphaera sp.]
MTLVGNQQALVAEFSAIRDSQARLARVVERGRRHPPLAETQRVEANRVEGCLARLWLACEFRASGCHFACDSDSAVVKGVAALLCEFYSGYAPAEIISVEPTFLAEIGITQHLTANRRNALTRVRETIRTFAQRQLKTSSSPNEPPSLRRA